MPDLEESFLLASGLILFLALGLLVHVYTKVGIGLFILLAALSTNLRSPVTATLTLGSLQVTALDLIAIIMLASGIFQALAQRSAGRQLWPLWLLVAIMLLNATRGLSKFGLQHTADELRSWLYLLAILVYSSIAAITDAAWWRRAATLYVCGLILVVLVGLSGTGLGAATTRVQLDGQLVDPRPLTSFGALVIADGLLFLVGRRLHRRGGSLMAIAVLVASLVVLQQRTVWIATAIAGVYLGFLALRAGGRARLAAALGAALAFVVVAAGFLTGAVQRSVVAVSAENITQSDNTLTWRFDGWKDLLTKNFGTVQAVIGEPFGSGYSRTVNGVNVTVSPHSHYVEMFLRFGVIGSVAFVVLTVFAWRAAPAAAIRLNLDTGAIRAVLVALVVAGVTYRWDIMQGLVLGTILGAAAPSTQVAAPEPGGARRGQSRLPGLAGLPASVGAGLPNLTAARMRSGANAHTERT